MGALGCLAELACRQHLTAFPALRGPENRSEGGSSNKKLFSTRFFEAAESSTSSDQPTSFKLV